MGEILLFNFPLSDQFIDLFVFGVDFLIKVVEFFFIVAFASGKLLFHLFQGIVVIINSRFKLGF